MAHSQPTQQFGNNAQGNSNTTMQQWYAGAKGEVEVGEEEEEEARNNSGPCRIVLGQTC